MAQPGKWRWMDREAIVAGKVKKQELFNAVYWIRQVFALVFGLIMGVLPVTGYLGNLGFAALCALTSWLYYAKYLGVDEEEYGRWELLAEGMNSAFGLFLLVWICTFSVLYN